MKKVLILKSNKDEFEKFYINRMQTTSIHTVPIYKHSSGIGWKVQVIWIEKLHLPFEQIWYGDWWKDLSQVDKVIVFDRNLGWSILKKIKKKNKNIHLIAWYWNIAEKKVSNRYRKICDIWSFDKDDCEKLGFRYNTQFYFPNIYNGNGEVFQDVLFVGKDKGRYNTIVKIQRELNRLGMKTIFKIIRDKTSGFKHEYSDAIGYEQVLDEIKKSKAILDVPQYGQSGMTVRVLESIFLYRKLISTDVELINKEYYDEENMYVWKLDERNLVEFIEKPYVKSCFNEQLREKYSFTNWINRFEEEELNKWKE